MTGLSWLIPVAAFATVFVLALLITQIVAGGREARLRHRLQSIKLSGDEASSASLIREKYLHRFSPLERRLEELQGMPALGRLVEQAGYGFPAYRVVAAALALAFGGAAVALGLSLHPALVALIVLVGLAAPFVHILQKRSQRVGLCEEQLPDALDMMARALRAGNPLVETFKFVADEMDDPIAKEIGTTWTHLNYGVSLKAAFDDLIRRMPTMSLRAVVTAILVQRETGGNLAEILDKLGAVLRSRFRFQRRVHTLSAEGRMSAWVLILMPFFLAGMLAVTSPTYLPMLIGDPMGQRLIIGALILMAVGTLWIRRVIRIHL